MPHKRSRRLTPRLGKKTIYGWKLAKIETNNDNPYLEEELTMGLFDFAANIGRKLFGKDEEAPAKIEEHIAADNPGISDLGVEFNDGVVTLSGQADSSEALEKAVLMAGNVKGVKKVVSDGVTAPPLPDDVIQKTSRKYKEALTQLTGKDDID